MANKLAHALGIGRKVDPFPPRRPGYRYLIGDHAVLAPWPNRFRFGYVLTVAGPYKQTAIGVVGPDWDGGKWLGGSSWKRHGPVAVCRYGRRGSWRSDRRMRKWEADGFLPPGVMEAVGLHVELGLEQMAKRDARTVLDLPKTKVPKFVPGRGRPDLEMLHQVLDMLDAEWNVDDVREDIAQYLNHRYKIRDDEEIR